MGEEFDLSNKSEQQLRELIGSQKPGTDFRVACELALEKLQRKKEFWRKDIILWISLGVSILALVVAVISILIALRVILPVR